MKPVFCDFAERLVVSDMAVGYLARLAFSADDWRVFFGDYDAAVRYLSKDSLPDRLGAWL